MGLLSAAVEQFLFPSDRLHNDGNVKFKDMGLLHRPDLPIRQFSLRVVDPAAAFRLMDGFASALLFVLHTIGPPYRYIEIQPGSKSPLEKLFHLGGCDHVFRLVSGYFVPGEGGGLVSGLGGMRC